MYSSLLPASKASPPDLSVLAQPVAAAPPQRRLLDQLPEQLRYLHYSLRTEEAYVRWVRAFVRWSGMRHPRQMGAAEVQAFLAWLAAERRVSVAEVRAVLALLDGTHAVLGQLLYGTGIRITEALQLRTKDVDFERGVIVVREGKAGKDRVVMLPSLLAQALKAQLRRAHGLWLADARAGRGGVQMPDALLPA